jgi:MYXO-CTERM domain-containing protein
VCLYFPAADYSFITLDDNEYVYDNECVQHGLTVQGICCALAGKATNSAETFSVTLPAACDNQPQVYLRWKYYSLPVSGASGSRPRLRLDDISVAGVPEPALLGLAGLLLLALRRK